MKEIIDEKELIKSSAEFRDLRQLEKDYLQTLTLYEIYNFFSKNLIFKGGTSLKYFYNLNRFSEDLDFSFIGENSTEGRRMINKLIQKALGQLNLQYNVVKVEHRGNEENGVVVGLNYEIRIEGPLNRRLKHFQNIKIDISLGDDLLREPQVKYFLPKYQDIPSFLVPIMDMYEIGVEKVSSIL